MTLELFFILTYPTYDPTVNFSFNFLTFHSDALICHLLFLFFIFPETTPPMAPHIAHQGANRV
jgi:hypothetical protein